MLPHGVCLPCFPAMNRFFAAAAPRNLRSFVVAAMVLAAALLPLSPVQALASPVASDSRSPYANLGVDELSQYLRHQKKRMQADVGLEESVVKGTSSDNAGQVHILSAPLPWGASASVSARLEPVDLDRLRAITANAPERAREQETRVGVDGAVRLGDVGALRIGYEVTQWQDKGAAKVAPHRIRKCPGCGRVFVPANKRAKYCNRACNNKVQVAKHRRRASTKATK
jgi:hypothetical protein